MLRNRRRRIISGGRSDLSKRHHGIETWLEQIGTSHRLDEVLYHIATVELKVTRRDRKGLRVRHPVSGGASGPEALQAISILVENSERALQLIRYQVLRGASNRIEPAELLPRQHAIRRIVQLPDDVSVPVECVHRGSKFDVLEDAQKLVGGALHP